MTARPTSLFNDKAATCLSKTYRERYFVSASAGFASPWTLNNRKSPRRRPSWTHSRPTARCLTRQISAHLQIPTAAAESVRKLKVMLKPRSRPILWIPSASVVPLTIPHSSASAELSVTAFCVELQCLIRCEPLIAAPPEVLRRVAKHPAKSVCTNTSRFASGCHGNSYTRR